MTESTVKKKSARKTIAKAKTISTPIVMETISPMQQITTMKDMGLSADDLKQMLVVQKEYEAHEAEKLFNIALANFKAEDILITKDKSVSFRNNDSTMTEYSHATLGNIVETAVPFMSKYGLSHRWKINQGDSVVTVTFVLTHSAGHSEETVLSAGADNSGKKNPIQQVASTITYLERYTFLAGTGLAVQDQMDNDGATPVAVELIDDEQVKTIDSMMDENELSWDLFWAWVHKKFVGVEKVEHFPATSYDVVIAKINQSIDAKKQAEKQ